MCLSQVRLGAKTKAEEEAQEMPATPQQTTDIIQCA